MLRRRKAFRCAGESAQVTQIREATCAVYLVTSHTSYGRGAGVGRGLGVGSSLGVGVGLGVEVGVGVVVAVAVGITVAVGVVVAVGVGVGVIAPDCTQYLPPVLR